MAALWKSSGLLSRVLKRVLAQAETKQVRWRTMEVMGKRMERVQSSDQGGGGWKPHLARFMQSVVLIGEAAPDRQLSWGGRGLRRGGKGWLDSVPGLRGSQSNRVPLLPARFVSLFTTIRGLRCPVVDVASKLLNQAMAVERRRRGRRSQDCNADCWDQAL
jgi:hypothetical protein